jgi:hypothetical protein
VAASIPFYEKARTLAPGHFAAHHYLTHAYENNGRIAEALAEGETFAKMAPQVPHARHMFGHNLRRAGRVQEAIAEFLAADSLAVEYFKAEKIPVEYDWHYQHNLDLLATSYQYLGQMTAAEQRFRASFAIPLDACGAGVRQARVAGVSPGARACRRGAGGGWRPGGTPIADRQRHGSRRSGPRASGARAVQASRRRRQRRFEADAGNRRRRDGGDGARGVPG